jgi:hypothetical protein
MKKLEIFLIFLKGNMKKAKTTKYPTIEPKNLKLVVRVYFDYSYSKLITPWLTSYYYPDFLDPEVFSRQH